MASDIRKKQKELKKLVNKNDLKGIVSFIKENINEEDLDFDIIHNTYGVSEKKFINLFNDNGEIIKKGTKNLWNILFNKQIKEIMMKTDINWEQGFSPLQVEYIKYSLKNPEIDYAFQLIGTTDIDETLSKYFDGNDIKDSLFNDIRFDSYVLKKLISNPDYKKRFTPLEIEIIKKSELLDTIEYLLFTKPFWRQELSKYFDGKKILPQFYKEVIMQNTLEGNDYIAKRYRKHINKSEFAFVELIKNNSDLITICNKNNINLDNFQEYFEIENQNLKLKQAIVQKALVEKDFLVLSMIDKEDYTKYNLSENQILIIEALKSQKSVKIKNAFLEILKEKEEIQSFNVEELQSFLKLLTYVIEALEKTNSRELHQFKGDILIQLMNNPNPQMALKIMNDIYTKNNLPDVGKAYLIFKTLHPNYGDFNLDEKSNISPALKNCKTDNERDIIIFSDLLRVAFGSNNRAIRDYLINIKEGNELFLNLDKNNMENLSEKELNTLKEFLNHLIALYNKTPQGKENPKVASGDLIADLEELKALFKPTEKYDLPDRIVRSFGYYAGFKNYNDAWEYFVNRTELADKRNRLYSEKLAIEDFKLEQGDFIKGIGDLKYLRTILQNGSVAKEFLSIGARSDLTPLDTDLTKITDANETLETAIHTSRSSNFGPIYFILKNDAGITISRDDLGNEIPCKPTDLEAFSTGRKGHYGIRTGFATTEVDYIVIKNESVEGMLPEVKHAIVTNGFYIPVIDSKGKLLFSSQEYDEMKQKLSGLKYYTNDDFVFSKNLNVDDRIDSIKASIDTNIADAEAKKKKINEILRKKLSEAGIEFKDNFDSDISLGNVQLIDTGSTGRGTQTEVVSDFDFIMRLDSDMNSEKIKGLIFEAFNIPKDKDIMKNIRLKGVKIDDSMNPIDLDISFVKKSDTNFYSTDAALKDRLEQIKKQDPDKYKDVVANIILAKQVLKEAKVYKPNHARENSQGGLGGVGIENWILQHGGSFYDAAVSFVEASKGKSFDSFSDSYKVWDYGMNFYNGKFDEFVSQNMNAEGYRKMKSALEEYLKSVKVINKDITDEQLMQYENQLKLAEDYNRFVEETVHKL